MSYVERVARLVYWLLWVVIAVVVAVVGRDIAAGHLPFGSPVDPQTGTSALDVATDAGTGCQYILTPWGGIMPRTGRDGRQVCLPKP